MARANLRQTVEGERVYEVRERTTVIPTRLPYGGARFDANSERRTVVSHADFREVDDTPDFRDFEKLMRGNRGVL